MDEPAKGAWSGPELIVLVRGKPEEAVLTACKHYTRTVFPTAGDDGCKQPVRRAKWVGAPRKRHTPYPLIPGLLALGGP
jgi:hypothetical protein